MYPLTQGEQAKSTQHWRLSTNLRPCCCEGTLLATSLPYCPEQICDGRLNRKTGSERLPARATPLTCTQRERQAVPAGRKLWLPAVCQAPSGCVYPSKYWQPHWGKQMSGSCGPPQQAHCLSAAVRVPLLVAFVHTYTCQNVPQNIFEHTMVFFFIPPMISQGLTAKMAACLSGL